MNQSQTSIYIQRHPFLNHRTEVLMLKESPEGRRYRVEMRCVEVLDEATEMPPTFTLQPDEAQSLVDELHRNGYRPSHQVEEASALKHVAYHLEDMRRLVFEKRENADFRQPESKD